jgi:hypothetical protein
MRAARWSLPWGRTHDSYVDARIAGFTFLMLASFSALVLGVTLSAVTREVDPDL